MVMPLPFMVIEPLAYMPLSVMVVSPLITRLPAFAISLKPMELVPLIRMDDVPSSMGVICEVEAMNMGLWIQSLFFIIKSLVVNLTL